MDMNNFFREYQQFRNQMGSNVNPNQMIQEMMNNGKISQSQYNMARNLANQIQQGFRLN